MENDSNKLIAEKVENGSYFKDALDWYSFKYIYPLTTRSAILFITILLAFAAYIIIKVAAKDYQQKQYPFPIYAENEVLYTPNIKPLSNVKEAIDVSVARYFSTQYLLLRESYNSLNFNDKVNKTNLFNKLQSLSSKKIFNDYNDFIDPDINPDSPIIKYKSHTRRIIKIKNIELKGNPLKPDYAIFIYESIEKSKNNEVITLWKAEIDFMMSNIGKVYDKQAKLQFVVTRYRTYKL